MALSEKILFKNNAKTFSFAALILDNQVLEKVITLYAFCRIIDDIADDSPDPAIAKKTLEKLANTIKTEATDDLKLVEFIQFIKKNAIDKKYISHLLNGVVSDCQSTIHLETEDQLLNYCYRVAGTVGGMMCPLLGIQTKNMAQAISPAIHLGIAMQLTNIARDIKEDAANNRIYIPYSWQPLESKMLLQQPNSHTQDARKACQRILDLADLYYQSAQTGYAFIPLRSRVCILIASNLYRAIGIKIKRQNYAYWQGRVYLTLFEKIIASIWALRQTCYPQFWFYTKNSDQALFHGNADES